MRPLSRRGGNILCLYFVLLLVISVTSCVAPKNYVYFHNLKKDTAYPQGIVVIDSLSKYHDPKIQVNDILTVEINIFNPLSEEQANAAQTGKSENKSQLGYLVDKDGYIELQLVGFVKVVGLTTSEAREVIKQKAKEFYKDPTVNVHISNFEVTVQGEVNKPGIVNIHGEKANILDVLALAGDLKSIGRRNNILIARTENDRVTFARLNITSTDIYKSPYFYVRQRDYIYVEPSNFARQNTDNSFQRYSAYFTSAVGIFSLLLFSRIIKIY